MRKTRWLIGGTALLFILGGIAMWKGTETARYLVYNGEARAVIVRQNGVIGKDAIEELGKQIKRATNVELPIIDYEQLETTELPNGHMRILVGPGPLTEAAGIQAEDLEQETYRILRKGNDLILTGKSNTAIVYAVSYFLDTYLDIRFLWPGDVGTYVPKRRDLEAPDVDVTRRPLMEQRRLRVANPLPEATRWLNLHMMGSRSQYGFGHAFTEWYARYGKDHPDFFAQPPEGMSQVTPDRMKLDLSNTAIDEVILNEWVAAGKPDNWNVSPNDGSGFCVSPGCLAMDDPPNQSIRDIWYAEGNLTARYVTFWNRLLDKMKPLNPNLTLSTYAYSSYKEPPTEKYKLKDGMVIGFVHTFEAYEQWKGWHNTGATLVLRPNWWFSGAAAPNLMLHATGDYFKFAHDNGMIGFDFDSILGHWGTQGLNYYLIARLSVRPELTVDDVIGEYVSAFGQAAPAIRDYIQYWETYAIETAYNVSAGNGVTMDPNGRYETVVTTYDLPRSPLNGGWYSMPYLYPNEVIAAARVHLDRASELAAHDDDEVKARIQFLRDGLRHLELTRDVVALGYEKSRPANATKEQYIALHEQLDQFRRDIAKRHVIWYDAVTDQERRRDIPTAVERTKNWDVPKPAGPSGAELDEKFIGL